MPHHRAMIFILLLGLCVASNNGLAQSEPRQLVLVCSAELPATSLTHTEVRQLFLGMPTEKNGVDFTPLRNSSDPLITEVFLQKIIFMSKRNYERQLATRVFRLGGARPAVYSNVSELRDALRQSPGAVSYMWAKDVLQDDDLKSIGVLWQGSVD